MNRSDQRVLGGGLLLLLDTDAAGNAKTIGLGNSLEGIQRAVIDQIQVRGCIRLSPPRKGGD